MTTLNQIADEIGDALDRPKDWMFKERVKAIFRHEAATFIRQAIDKNGMSDHFKSKFIANIEIVDSSNLDCGNNCVIRTTAKVVEPIRIKSDVPFSFVGSHDCKVVYIYTKCYEYQYADLTEVYKGKPIRYIYQNGYIYILGNKVCGNITYLSPNTTPSGTTVCTSASHELSTGETIVVSGAPAYNGTYIITLIDDDSFYINVAYSGLTNLTWIKELEDNCISIEGAFGINSVLENTIEGKLNNVSFNDNTILPIPEDSIQGIKLKLLQGELSITDSKDKIQPKHIDN